MPEQSGSGGPPGRYPGCDLPQWLHLQSGGARLLQLVFQRPDDSVSRRQWRLFLERNVQGTFDRVPAWRNVLTVGPRVRVAALLTSLAVAMPLAGRGRRWGRSVSPGFEGRRRSL